MLRASLIRCVLVLAACLVPVSARAQVLWFYHQHNNEVGPATMGIRDAGVDPATLMHGTIPGPGLVDQVVVAQHILSPGQAIPLPMYRDGTQAQESELFWTAQIWNANISKDWCYFPASYSTGDMCSIGFNGRTFVGGTGAIEVVCNTPGGVGARITEVQVVVTVIAVRMAQPVGTQNGTWGKLKAAYR